MASSVKDGQTACMGEIQTDNLPLSQTLEEHLIQQDEQDQAIQHSCSESDVQTQVESELQKQSQEQQESGEQSLEQSECREELQPSEQLQEWFESDEKLQSSKPVFESMPTKTEGITLELCWYCIKSLPIEELNIPQLQLENEAITSPYGSEHLSYLQDPRPHFGVARSSHSIPFPLWDREGPREMKRDADEEDADSVTSCPHCHLGLPLHTLRWHEEKCLLFEGLRKDA